MPAVQMYVQATCDYTSWLSQSLFLYEVQFSYSVSMPMIHRIRHEFLILCHRLRIL